MPSFLDIFRNYLPTWNEVRNKPSSFDPGDHSASHQNGGTDEISVAALSGTLADEQNAGALKAVIIDDAGKADQWVLGYDSGSDRIIYIELPSS